MLSRDSRLLSCLGTLQSGCIIDSWYWQGDILRLLLGVCNVLHSLPITVINRVNWAQWGSDYAAGWQGAAGKLSECVGASRSTSSSASTSVLVNPGRSSQGDTDFQMKIPRGFGSIIMVITLSVECQVRRDVSSFFCVQNIECILQTYNHLPFKAREKWELLLDNFLCFFLLMLAGGNLVFIQHSRNTKATNFIWYPFIQNIDFKDLAGVLDVEFTFSSSHKSTGTPLSEDKPIISTPLLNTPLWVWVCWHACPLPLLSLSVIFRLCVRQTKGKKC